MPVVRIGWKFECAARSTYSHPREQSVETGMDSKIVLFGQQNEVTCARAHPAQPHPVGHDESLSVGPAGQDSASGIVTGPHSPLPVLLVYVYLLIIPVEAGRNCSPRPQPARGSWRGPGYIDYYE